MKLSLDGITRNTESPAVIAELKKAGYKEVPELKEKELKVKVDKATEDEKKEGG